MTAGPAGNWTGTFQSGERAATGVITAQAMSFSTSDPGFEKTVVAADGQDVAPVTVTSSHWHARCWTS